MDMNMNLISISFNNSISTFWILNFFELPTGKMHVHTFSSYINGISVMMNRWMKLLIATSEHHPPWNWQLERWTTAKVMDLLLKHLREKSKSVEARGNQEYLILLKMNSARYWYPFQIFSTNSTFIATWGVSWGKQIDQSVTAWSCYALVSGCLEFPGSWSEWVKRNWNKLKGESTNRPSTSFH